jgi:hypothetical protein
MLQAPETKVVNGTQWLEGSRHSTGGASVELLHRNRKGEGVHMSIWLKSAIAVALALNACAWALEPAGMVLLASEDARLIRGEPRAARMGDLLEPGDILEAGSGNLVFVFCPNRLRYVISAGTTVRLSESEAVFEGPAPRSTPAGACSLPTVQLGAESLERVGGLRPRGKPPIEVFLGGVISSGRPLFTWRAAEHAESYRLAVSNEVGAVLWEDSSRTTELTYGGPPLEDGWYSWSIRAERSSEVVAQQSTRFEVRSSPEFATASAVLTGADALLEAFRLENSGYPAEAAAMLRQVLEQQPEDLRLRRRLAWLYWKAGLLPAFDAELQLLEATGGKGRP